MRNEAINPNRDPAPIGAPDPANHPNKYAPVVAKSHGAYSGKEKIIEPSGIRVHEGPSKAPLVRDTDNDGE